ncbi:alpha/beta hydrolase [Enemella evansiae]|uniref:Alpha/beta hydrolase n=1 Tax=Enemella evansiae TaxID=2016499 RepID=A0A255GTP6_9ACTN|nr:hypothetical protein [Enemella evansiae]OYO09341.1 alpha/beta hydrolase [Enemella evansiae]OYO17893.1 alpha/beta hydrolase [Enemella evansiae]
MRLTDELAHEVVYAAAEQESAVGEGFRWIGTPDQADAGQFRDTVSNELGRAPVHLIASGLDAEGALSFAAEEGDRLVSLVLIDPQVDESNPDYWELLGRVHVPSLVIAAAPEPNSPVAQAQSVAGGIENGVFVIIDGITAPSHRSRPASFVEWGGAFMVIAEGLAADRLPDHT